jgi:predicted AAA+ superfamily ATPase
MPYHQNFGKRLIKTPKLYFLDTGLMCWLLGITQAKSLETHAMRGAIFETYVVSELLKQRYNQGQANNLYFWRDNVGHEIDIIYETEQGLQAIEIKSGVTFAQDWLNAIKKWQKFASAQVLTPMIIYGGDKAYLRENCQLINWNSL